MSVLVNKDTKVLVQGFTGSEGTFHATQMIEYGTNVVGGVTPGKGGQKHLDRPVFETVSDAVKATGADVSIIFVPPPFAADAIMEAAEAGIKVIVCITEGIPVKDMVAAREYIRGKGCTLIGPNCPGVITAEECKVGIMPGFVFKKGTVGIVSKSGTLTYEAADQVVKAGLGITTAIGIGGDPIIGTTTLEAVQLFANDPETKAIVIATGSDVAGLPGVDPAREGRRSRAARARAELELEEAAEDVVDDEGAEVADVGGGVNGRAAVVEAEDAVRLGGLELARGAGQGLVETDRHGEVLTANLR